ncbi:MAG: SUMF1/EgtB/PvdO family nonheme iron enzyme [Planctomycetota bacterium]|jgi:formylglycine-generating enzyme required for sulfatase activity
MKHQTVTITLLCMLLSVVFSGSSLAEDTTNSIGMKLIRIKPGTFMMGSNLGRDNWDEQPIHKVAISKPFYISETEVTVEQFKLFKKDFQGTEGFGPYAAGVSWYDAAAFCKWLSEKEGKAYRLPTEAEWEYACRAGTTTLFSSGQEPPKEGESNPWGVKNMHTGVREWCLDWHGEYAAGHQIDPIGPEFGIGRIVRGGSLDDSTRDASRKTFSASSNRGAIAPGFGPHRESATKSGYHPIGFRVVQGSLGTNSKPLSYEARYVQQGVKQSNKLVKIGPDLSKPYFRKRYILPTPLENSTNEEIDAAGLHPSFRRHNHSPTLEVCSNGDVLMITYTSYREYEPGVSLIGSRLRFGTDQWDMPTSIFDFVTVNDHCPMLWREGDNLYFFWGNPKLQGGFPFQWTLSKDNGATWDEINFPMFTNEAGSHSRQPINTAFRDPADGIMYLSSDGSGGKSVLWASPDNGLTWYDTGGRSAGRHTTYVLLKNGSILGMGGKNTSINGFMPKSISKDGGKTWIKGMTPFPAQGSNQRPSVVRLQSGRIFFAGDFQHVGGRKPEGITQRGSYAALSDDEGLTWKIKTLIGTQTHENPKNHKGADTIGYSVARQAPNGIIHLMTTMNRPCLHLAMNEAWILSETARQDSMTDEELMKPTATNMSMVRQYQEKYPNGQLKVDYSGGIADDGRFVQHNTETWYYENGQKQRQANYKLGRKVGVETYWAKDGKKKWSWKHREDGTSVWIQNWPNGKKKAKSTWKNFKCNGKALLWDINGNKISDKNFVNGKMTN